jgi:hypothetical protein
MTAVGTIGSTYMVGDEQFYFKDGNVSLVQEFQDANNYNYFLYDFMQTEQFHEPNKRNNDWVNSKCNNN